ncbi:MDR family MFS transporter [Tessaracoccus flavus]|uniref:MDR family MFS transporter n=1 Tax=Tessaracoccus flavus TaxID=1610493 RepID=UPI00089696D2|nr:MDR family MFS transporter [Tessaracoccus flavus]SDZ14341.1 drug resistance transporter, EmrB/QacA subfamily [Tessaracoccus flavus]
MTNPSQAPATFDFGAIKWAYIGLVIGMFTASISQTIVSPAIPRIVADLGGLAWYSWLSTIVMLVSAVITPISGKLADIFGRRRFYIIGLVLFMIGSMLSGLAMTFGFLIFARTVQGIGMGILMPLSQTILGAIIPARQRGKYQSYMGAVMGASQVAGPLLGGWVTDVSSWRWLFYISLPVGLAALVIVVRHLHVPELSIPAKIDYAGISTMTVGVSSTLLGISLGGATGWLTPQVLLLLGVGVTFVVAFVLIERKAEEPIVPLPLFRNSVFTVSTVAAFFMNMGMMAVLIYIPVYAQGVLRMTATESGLILMPMNVVLFAIGIVVGNLITKTGHYKEFAVAGGVFQIVGALLMLRLDAASSGLEVVVSTGVLGFGYGLAFQIYMLAVQNAVQRRDLGTATSSLQFFRNIGNTLGTAIAGTIMTTHLMSGIESRLTPELRERIPTGGLDPNAVLNPGKLAYLPVELADIMRASLADAMHAVFLLLPVLTALSLLATIFIKPLKLRDTLAQPEDRGREILDSTAMSSPDQERMLSPEDEHARRRERIMGAHLVLLAEQVHDDNPILRDAVADFGGGDLERGIQILRSTGTLLLTEDPAVMDEHEAFAVELSKRGQQQRMLSESVTARLDAVAELVSLHRAGTPTKPRIDTPDGIDGAGLRRALMMLDSALVADIATRRWDDTLL